MSDDIKFETAKAILAGIEVLSAKDLRSFAIESAYVRERCYAEVYRLFHMLEHSEPVARSGDEGQIIALAAMLETTTELIMRFAELLKMDGAKGKDFYKNVKRLIVESEGDTLNTDKDAELSEESDLSLPDQLSNFLNTN